MAAKEFILAPSTSSAFDTQQKILGMAETLFMIEPPALSNESSFASAPSAAS